MSLLGGWILVPVVLALLSAGLGLLAERAAGVRLPGALVPVVGLAALIAVAGLLTLADATAELAAPACALLAAIGLALARPWRDPRLRGRGAPAALVAALAAFSLAAAPSLLTGQGSIAGYTKLDDSATWIGHTAHVMEHGRNVDGVAPSTTRAMLDAWLVGGYPVGSFLGLGVASELSGQDPASGYQAVLAAYAALLALGLAACARQFAGGPWAAAAVGVAGSQASMFAGYLQWGGIKEGAAAALITALAMLAALAWRRDGIRTLALAALVTGALVGVLGINGAAWAAPALALGASGAGLPLLRRPDALARLAPAAVAVGAVLLIASWPAISTLEFFKHTTGGAITAQDDLGNLIEPLSPLQGAGLWPAGDFRFDPDPRAAAVLLALLCLAGCVAATVIDGRRARRDPTGHGLIAALVAVTAAGALPALALAGPWADAKVLAIASPAVLAAAAALAAYLLRRSDTSAIGAALGTVLAAGCAWSIVSIVGDVIVAPRERLAELHSIGERIAGQGPTLVLEFDIYASRHFLRKADVEGATDLRIRRVRSTNGRPFEDLSDAEVDRVAMPDLFTYRTLVRRRSPVASRPPAAYERVWSGDSYEVWQRAATARPPAPHMPLGSELDPTGKPDCSALSALARRPGAREIIAVPRRSPIAALPEAGGLRVEIPTAGRWRPWVGGSPFGRLDVSVDGRSVGSVRHDIAFNQQWLAFDALELAAGSHVIGLRYRRGARAGADFALPELGPVLLAPVSAERDLAVTRIPVGRWRELCRGDARFDWIEIA